MAYAYVGQGSNDTGGSSLTAISVTYTPTASSLLIFAIGYANASAQSITMSDAGKGNAFSEIKTGVYSTGNGYGARFFFAPNCLGGSTTFTGTLASSSTFLHMALYEYSGIGPSPFIDGILLENNAPGVGTDIPLTGSANCSQQPAMQWAFAANLNNTAPFAGSAFLASGVALWSGVGIAETQRIMVTGSSTAAFTVNQGSDDYLTCNAFFAEASGLTTILLGQICI